MHGPISTVLRQPAPRPPRRQHDGDAAVTHGRTPVERSAHRASCEARLGHVVHTEHADTGGGLKALIGVVTTINISIFPLIPSGIANV